MRQALVSETTALTHNAETSTRILEQCYKNELMDVLPKLLTLRHRVGHLGESTRFFQDFRELIEIYSSSHLLHGLLITPEFIESISRAIRQHFHSNLTLETVQQY
jgi:hypothetical protein